MELSEQVSTNASAQQCWAAITDVTTWPQWTKSMTSVEPLDETALAVGHRYRVTQPRMPKLVWQVTDLTDGKEFIWQAKTVGVRITGYHRVTPNPNGSQRISIGISFAGPLAGLVGAMSRARNERYLKMEAAGLKAASEASLAADE